MVKYICEICSTIFMQKGHFEKHKARKRPCTKDNTIEALIEQKVQEALASASASASASHQVVANIIVEPEEKKEPVTITGPFMKWVGGKTQILESVMELFPKKIQNYYEPFLGGGSVLLGLLSHMKHGSIEISGKIYASDLNSNLIGLYKNIQKYPDLIIAEIKKLVDEFKSINGSIVNRKASTLEDALTSPESYYFWIRSRFNKYTKDERQSPIASAMLLFMNKTCFRGVYREGPNGFNVPFGNYKNPGILDEMHIRRVSELIKDVVFTHCSFTDALNEVKEGDFVYMDPPYAPETENSFVSYTSDGFSLESHQTLFNICEKMNAEKIKIAMSNANVTLVTNAFPSPMYSTKIISCRRAINSKNPESKTNEVLITN